MVKYVAVWLDHKEARVFHIHPERIDETLVSAPLHNIHHKHPGSTERDKAHPDDSKRFFAEIGRTLDDAEQVLVVGPSTAKLEFVRHVHAHQPALEQKIVGIETVDHPTDGQLVTYAKRYFGVRDRGR
jgi:stalled ribosome rescue protein Dom34